MKKLFPIVIVVALAGCTSSVTEITRLRVLKTDDQVIVLNDVRGDTALVVQSARDFRPFLHPILTPDGTTSVTQFSPDHHRHQTGLYWGFTRLNGRDYFHHPEGDYWQRDTVMVTRVVGDTIGWVTVYDLLDEKGNPVLQETQNWTMYEADSAVVLDLTWTGKAISDIVVSEYDYGGLFLRMPWAPGMEGRAVNAARQRNHFAEGQRAMWMDVGLILPGREDMAHVAIFDHPDNADFPQPWRVDGQLGVGPVRARLGNWTIEAGNTETIRHRLLVYTGEMSDIAMRAKWEDYADRSGAMYSTASLWGLAQQEAREAEFLSPVAAAEMMTLKEGYEVNAWAGEPLLTQPMAFAWDDRGRLWVAENRDYESRQTGFSGSGDSRIVILEDTDRDGTADVRKVFMEGIAFPSALAVGFDGVFLGAPPHLLFIPDRDGDDRADVGDIEIRLTGWGIRDRHETINSFHWGPDGWLYGLEGFATSSVIRKPGPEARLYGHEDPFPEDLLEADGVEINGGVWRYHPTKDKFETVAHGFSNPWGIDYDAHGELFISACVIPHVFHVIPGGIYMRQGGTHLNPHIYEDIAPIVDHRHRSAHGGARIYQSDAFAPEETGRLFMANIHEHAVLSDVLQPSRSGFTASHGDEFMMAHNAQWVGFSMEIGPEGALYVLDWHDADICGGDVLDKDTGRIFRITPSESHAVEWDGRYGDLRQLSNLELAELQESRSDWHARRARVILQHRASTGALDASALTHLNVLYETGATTPLRLRAMWSLYITGNLPIESLSSALQDNEPYVRAWAVRLIAEQDSIGSEALLGFEELAGRETSPVVRKYLAAMLQQISYEQRWPIIAALMNYSEDSEDPNIPTLLWTGFEPLVAEAPERALSLIEDTDGYPRMTEFVGRRLVEAGHMSPLLAALHSNRDEHLLRGMLAGLEGMGDIEAPTDWDRTYRRLRRKRETRALATAVAQLFGDAEAERALMSEVLNSSMSSERRIAALKSLVPSQPDALRQALFELVNDPSMRVASIQAVAAFSDQELGQLLLSMYTDATPSEKEAIIQTMASRPIYGWMLVEALRDGSIQRNAIPVWIARQMRRVVGSGFVEIWGPIDELPGDKASTYTRYQSLVTSGTAADISNGQTVFAQACGACHQMNGVGGLLGPDLTGSNRTNVDYLLSNLIYPDEFIQDDYRMVLATTRGGRTYIGTLVGESDRQVTLRPVGQEDVVLNRTDIQSLEISEESLMPEGLLSVLSDEEIQDLFAYLRTVETSVQ
ncbi:MAG: PmoA family protein [Bacteroidetes bacterium]|nr:PmoA family protein [Bacteroidota bacterium]